MVRYRLKKNIDCNCYNTVILPNRQMLLVDTILIKGRVLKGMLSVDDEAIYKEEINEIVGIAERGLYNSYRRKV